jgi:hypothetical protein
VEKHTIGINLRRFFLHCCGILAFFSLTVLIRFPALVNSDYIFDYDSAFMATAILNLIGGGDFFFNYEGANYHGIIGGLTAIPFMHFLGVGSLAFGLPGSLYYSLYVWSSFLLARKIIPGAAFFVVLLMLFPPPDILGITLRNYTHTEICFLGNIIFLLFIHAKTKVDYRVASVFFLGFVMGLSVYWYTFSVLYLSSVLVFFIVTYDRWKDWRSLISFQTFFGFFKTLTSKRDVLVRILDSVMVFFCVAIIFSYMFGGFGLDIGGHSIFQINNLHKPVFQLLILFLVRLMIRHDDSVDIWNLVNRWTQSINIENKRIAGFGILGFLIGLLPRIIPIVTGDIKRGGAGFDMDFMPVKLLNHFWTLMAYTIPDFLGIRKPLLEWLNVGFPFSNAFIPGLISLVVIGLILYSIISIIILKKEDLFRVFRFAPVAFDPILILFVFVALLFISLVVTQNGPLVRYLYPLFGCIAIWVALALDKYRRVSKAGCAFFLFIWIGFYMTTTYKAFESEGFIKGTSVIRLPKYPLVHVIEFLKLKDIRIVYASYFFSSQLTFLSKGDVVGTEYNEPPFRGKNQRIKSAKEARFAVLLNEKEKKNIVLFKQHLSEGGIKYQVDSIKDFRVLWDFRGDGDVINGLRSLAGPF